MGEKEFNLSNIETDFNSQVLSHVFVKIHVKSIKSNIFGVILIQIDYDNKKMEELNVVASDSSHFIEGLLVKDSWIEHKNFIANKKFTGEFNRNISLDMINQINNLVSGHESYGDFINELLKYHKKQDINNIIELFKYSFARIVFDKGVIIEAHTEFVLQQEIDNLIETKQDRDNDEAAQPITFERDTFFDLDNDGTLVECAAVVSPVSGIPVFNLNISNEIMVRILNNTVKGSKFNEVFNLISPEGKILPKKAKVIKIKQEAGIYKVLVHIENNVFGKITEDGQIKIKHYEPLEESKKEDNNNFIWTTVVIILFIFSLIFSGFVYVFYS